MKVLIILMTAAAETGGPSGRCRLLADGFAEAGIVLLHNDFEPGKLNAAAERLIGSAETRKKASALGEKLIAAGGVKTIISELSV